MDQLMKEIPIFKTQIPSNLQIPIFKIQNKTRRGFGAGSLFILSCLVIRICLGFGY
jgi:hypothetical protein